MIIKLRCCLIPLTFLKFLLVVLWEILEILISVLCHLLYNSQINARILIGQSAMGYCASKPMEKLCVF